MGKDSYAERLEMAKRILEAERRREAERGPSGLDDLRLNPAFQNQGRDRGPIQRGPKLTLDQINQGN